MSGAVSDTKACVACEYYPRKLATILFPFPYYIYSHYYVADADCCVCYTKRFY